MLLNYPFLRFSIYLTTGIIISSLAALHIVHSVSIICIVLILLSILLFTKIIIHPALKESVVAAFLILTGCLVSYYHSEDLFVNHLLHHKNTVQGYRAVVTNIPEEKAKTYRVEVQIEAIKSEGKWKKTNARVSLNIAKDAPRLAYGDHITVLGEPTRTEAPKNPGEFDYQRYLRFKNIFYQQYLNATQFSVEIQSETPSILVRINKISTWASVIFRKNIKKDDEFGVIKAMVLGQRDNIDQQLTNAYAAAGAIHVLSVSGFHITIFFAILSGLLGFIKNFKNGTWLFTALMLFIIWIYAILTGLSPAVMRSATMFSIFLLAQALVRQPDSINSLLVSYFLLVCYDPFFIYSTGFQLSYAALSGILVLHEPIYQIVSFKYELLNRLWGVSVAAIAATVGTFPLCLFYFHQFPNYFLLVNPFVVILSSVLLGLSILFLAVSWIPLVGGFVGYVLEGTCWLLNQSVLFTESLPYSVTKAASISFTEMIVLYALIFSVIAIFYYRSVHILWLTFSTSIVWLIVNFWFANFEASQRKLMIHSLPNQTIISLTDGHHTDVLAAAVVLETPKAIDFYVKNALDISASYHRQNYDIRKNTESNFILHRTEFGCILIWHNKKIVIIEQPIYKFPALRGQFDWVICTKKSIKNLADLKGRFGSSTVVFDGSVPDYYLNPLFEQTKRNKLPFYFVKKEGAYVASW